MKPDEKPPSLDQLGEDIQRFQQKTAPKAAPSPFDAGIAMRMGVELVAGVLVGVGAGVTLDRWLGTTPWLLIVCFFLGAGGGSLNLWRLASAQSGDAGGQNAAEKKDQKDLK